MGVVKADISMLVGLDVIERYALTIDIVDKICAGITDYRNINIARPKFWSHLSEVQAQGHSDVHKYGVYQAASCVRPSLGRKASQALKRR
jgi:hypothetical protein